MNSNHPLSGKRESEITEQDLMECTEEQRREYVFWLTQKTLKYMVSEGLAIAFECPDTGETLYRAPTNEELSAGSSL